MMNLLNLVGFGKDIKTAFEFKREKDPVESYIRQQRSLEEMEAFQVKMKLDAIGMFLESCVNDDNTFQEHKWETAKEFAASMGLELHRCFKRGATFFETTKNGTSPAFYVTSSSVSDYYQDIAHVSNEKILGYDLMSYTYQVVETSKGIQRIFRQEFVGSPQKRECS